MKTKKFLGCLAALAMTLHASAQVAWDTNGNTVTGVSEWFGADASSTAPLRIETRVNQPIDWYTDAIQRVTLSPTYTGQTVNGYTGVDLSGFLGIGPFANALVDKPQAMLHLDGGGNQDSGWRPWMKQGTYITYTTDQAYLGLKAETNGSLECVDRDFSG